MDFNAYCEDQQKTNVEIGHELGGISGEYVGMLRHGKRKPGPRLRVKIYNWSGGLITANDWHPEMSAQDPCPGSDTPPITDPIPDPSPRDGSAACSQEAAA